MRRSILLHLIAAAATLAACGQRTPERPSLPIIAIATLMSHPALDAVHDGLAEGLAAEGLKEGTDYRVVFRNANGDMQLVSSIAADLSAQHPKVFVAITTPMAQAVRSRWTGPLVFAAVTDPVGAGVVSSLAGAPLVTGTSDAWPYAAQLKLIRTLQPSARRLAVLFNPGEAASQYGMKEIHRLAPADGFEVRDVPVSSTGEVAVAAAQALPRADALFLSSDNTVIAGVGAAVQVAIRAHKPLYAGDSGTVEKGAIAAVSVGYRALGVDAGRLTARMFRGERNLPVVVAGGQEVVLNLAAARAMGVTLPEGVVKHAAKTFTTIAH